MRAVLTSLLATVAALALILVQVIFELIATVAIYIYLNLYHLDTFGYLVRVARSVLDVLAGQIDYWMPVSSNVAYATLIGELGPKSILLLMLGLFTGAILRSIARLIGRWTARRSSAEAQHA